MGCNNDNAIVSGSIGVIGDEGESLITTGSGQQQIIEVVRPICHSRNILFERGALDKNVL